MKKTKERVKKGYWLLEKKCEILTLTGFSVSEKKKHLLVNLRRRLIRENESYRNNLVVAKFEYSINSELIINGKKYIDKTIETGIKLTEKFLENMKGKKL